MKDVISVKRLSKTYEYYRKKAGLGGSLKSLFHREKLFNEAVKEISFDIAEGEFVGFLGPNGAGKTTTLKMLSGILYPSGGEARVLGYVPWKRQHEYQKQFALVMGQKNQLWWDLPAEESFLLNKEIYEVPDADYRAITDELTKLLDIQDILDVQVRKLSLGQRMKCELVAALLHHPRVLFLDEPTIGLDVISQQHIRDFLKAYNTKEKTTILLTSHYMDDIERLCERVIIINHGMLGYDGKLSELMQKHIDHKQVTVTFLEDIARRDADRFGTVVEFNPKRVVLNIPNADVKHRAAKLLTDLPVDDILISEMTVEEVIRKVFETA